MKQQFHPHEGGDLHSMIKPRLNTWVFKLRN